ncbi:hypothetical protein PRJ39_06440 [Lysobacter enzymogenes]|uniref:hypothetical protein n=1 Tax=Lysobacter enzymogenes TaxID=69 RepID=UPI003749634F
MRWALAFLTAAAVTSCSAATPPATCAAYDEAKQINAAYRFPAENAGRAGSYGAISSSPTSMVLIDPKRVVGETARAVSFVKDPCCSVELIVQDCQRIYIRSTSGVFSVKAAFDNGYEMFPITEPTPPAPPRQ